MPFTKVWGNTAAVLSTAVNWLPVNVRNSAYAWTASGSGTNEYYLRTAGGANPGFAAAPDSVYANGSAVTSGTPGSLAAARWGYGDNDTLGYSTIYIRLSDGADPDSKTNGWVTFYQTPRAAEHIRFPNSSFDASSGLDYSAIASGDVIFDGYAGNIGTATNYAYFDPDKFEFLALGGQAFIDIGAAAIPVQITGTGQAASGERGLYLRGSAITVANIAGGSVGIAALDGETSTITTARVLGDSTQVLIGSGCGLTTLHVYGGEVRVRASSITTIIQYGGTIYLEGAASATTYTQYGGIAYWNSTGTIGTHNHYGGTWDETKNGAARTLTTQNLYLPGGTLLLNKEAVTRTNLPSMQQTLAMTTSEA